MNQYPVADMFRAPIQDGVKVGVFAEHLVLQGCPVGCAWCNERQTWPTLPEGLVMKSIEDIVEQVQKDELRYVFITGGEPFIHNLKPLMDTFRQLNYSVHIETSGHVAKELELYWLMMGSRPWITWSPRRELDFEAHLGLYQHVSEVKFVVDRILTLQEVEKALLHVPFGAYIIFTPEEFVDPDYAHKLFLDVHELHETFVGRVRYTGRMTFTYHDED